jgi:hypothetical protein
MFKHKVKRFGDGGITDQTEEEAANEAALNADLPRRKMRDAAAAEGAKDEKDMGVTKPFDSIDMGAAKPSYVSRTPSMASAPAKKMPARLVNPNPSAGSTDYSNEGRGSKPPDYSNEGRGSKPKVSTDFTPGKVPSSEQAAANRAAIGDSIKKGLSSVGDYLRNFKTPAERRSEEAKKSTSTMKRGGSVKKMASGGMASSRADGIAQRGKTRGKMC